MVLLTIASAVLLPLVFIKGWEAAPMAYVVYVLAFYTVTVLSVLFLYFAYLFFFCQK